jgi:hypothetical protein
MDSEQKPWLMEKFSLAFGRMAFGCIVNRSKQMILIGS